MSFNSPKKIVEIVNKIAEQKATMPNSKAFVAGILAGAYIAAGSFLALIVGGNLPGLETTNPGLQKFIFGAVFPMGLMFVAIAGADLFTGNTAYFVPSVLSKRMNMKIPLKNWVVVYIGNFIGSLIVAFLFAYLTGILKGSHAETVIQNIAESKISMPFSQALIKGIFCNWMVALAMWLSFASNQISGKMLGIWFPIMAFVAMGFEHSVANMFFIPTGIFYGANVSWSQFFIDNLIPVTIGNIIGGFIFVGMSYWYLYDTDVTK